MFGCVAIFGTSVCPEKSLYASSTRMSALGRAAATARMTSGAISLPVGLLGVVNAMTSG